MIRVDSGVYYIRNVITGRVYVGSTISCFRYRWNSHRKELENGVHRNRYLQNSWNKHGPKAFTFEIAEECEPDDCLEREQDHLDSLRYAEVDLYNICPTAGHPFRGRKHTAERNRQMSETIRQHFADPVNRAKLLGRQVTEETRQRLSEASREWWAQSDRAPRYKMTEEIKAKLSKSKAALYADPVEGKRIRELASKSLKGRRLTEEQKKHLSELAKKRVMSEETKQKIRDSCRRAYAIRNS